VLHEDILRLDIAVDYMSGVTCIEGLEQGDSCAALEGLILRNSGN
jgi:hypothetical protein